MSQKSYQTNMASEFYVLSTLSRLGYEAYLTLGNKKAIDIVIVKANGATASIDVKAVAGKMDWLLGNSPPSQVHNQLFVLLSYEGKFTDINSLPRMWVFPSSDLQQFYKLAQSTYYVPRKAVLDHGTKYENAWNLI